MKEDETMRLLRQQKNQNNYQALLFTQSNSYSYESELTFENDAQKVRNFSDSSIITDSVIGSELRQNQQRQANEALRKMDLVNGWAMAEGLISVFMKVGQRDPHTIVFRQSKSQTED